MGEPVSKSIIIWHTQYHKSTTYSALVIYSTLSKDA